MGVLEGIGEPHFLHLIIDKVLSGYKIIPHGVILKVDLAVAENIVFVEVEDTVFEIYSGTHQIM